MIPNKVYLTFIVTILFASACIAENVSRTTPTVAPTETRTATPYPTRTPIPTPFPTYLQATPIPAWVTGFADPILEAVVDRKPDFQDEFSSYRGWLNIVPGVVGAYYAERYDEMLVLRLPEHAKDSIVYNPLMNQRNFLLTLDLRFNHDQPNDTIRFQFDESRDQSVAFDFSNNRNWKFHWGPQDNWQSMSGIYEHFPPENIPVTIIMRGTQCAVYINNDPLTYSSHCRVSPTITTQKWVSSFRLIRDTAGVVVINVDNLKLWDLDKIPDEP